MVLIVITGLQVFTAHSLTRVATNRERAGFSQGCHSQEGKLLDFVSIVIGLKSVLLCFRELSRAQGHVQSLHERRCAEHETERLPLLLSMLLSGCEEATLVVEAVQPAHQIHYAQASTRDQRR